MILIAVLGFATASSKLSIYLRRENERLRFTSTKSAEMNSAKIKDNIE